MRAVEVELRRPAERADVGVELGRLEVGEGGGDDDVEVRPEELEA